jgi:DNA-binding NtrC family response regulator
LFPAAETPPPPAAPEVVVDDTAVTTGAVLVIDDERDVREAVSDILAQENIPVLTAPGGEAGLALYQERRDEIALVLLDLTMPGMSGEDTFRALRRRNPEIQVILSSGYNKVEATRRFLGKGLAGFMQKPYSAQRLVREVKRRLQLN